MKIMDGCKGEKNTKGSHADHGGEGFIIIKPFNLREPSSNQPGLEASKGPIQMVFALKGPLTRDRGATRREVDQCPSVVVNKGIIFIMNGDFPLMTIGRVDSFLVGRWFSQVRG